METLAGILKVHPFFADLGEAYLSLLVGCARNVRATAGQFLFRSGDEANQFYLVRTGKIALEICTPGRAALVVETVSEGQILGWSWLIPPYHWRFDARAVEATRAIALDGKCLRGKCERDHDLGYELLKRFAHVVDDRLQEARLQLLDVYGQAKGPRA